VACGTISESLPLSFLFMAALALLARFPSKKSARAFHFS
jgi:hypothetical protein